MFSHLRRHIADTRNAVHDRRKWRGKRERDRFTIVVEGTGSWTEDAYRPAIEVFANELHEQMGAQVLAYYVGIEEEAPAHWSLQSTAALREEYHTKDDDGLYQTEILEPDVVCVVTRDDSHMPVAMSWMPKRNVKTELILVEKPFGTTEASVDELFAMLDEFEDRGGRLGPAIFGIDHYALGLRALLDRDLSSYSGTFEEVEFVMTDREFENRKRLPSLRHGLTLDMATHFLGILAGLADLESLGDIEFQYAAQYEPYPDDDPSLLPAHPQIDIETCSMSTFSVTLWPEPVAAGAGGAVEPQVGRAVRCRSVVGKGLATSKYLDLRAADGSFVRVDLTADANAAADAFGGQEYTRRAPGYPYEHAFEARSADGTDGDVVEDPHLRRIGNSILISNTSPIGKRIERYVALFRGIAHETGEPLVYLLNRPECRKVTISGIRLLEGLSRWQERHEEVTGQRWPKHPKGRVPDELLDVGTGGATT